MNFKGRFQKIVSSLEGLRVALFDMDEDVFTLDDLYLLQRLLPDAEEIQKARIFRGDKKRLSKAERFFMVVAAGQCLWHRVECGAVR